MKTIDITKLKANDVLICVGSGELSEAIMKATNGTVSHTAQVIVLNDTHYIFDAQEGGCMPRLFVNWKHEFDYDFRVFRNPNKTRDLSDWFMQFSGIKYDKKGLAVGLLKSIVKNLFNTQDKMKEKYRNNGLFWCSELTMKPYVNEPEQYSPQDVLNFVEKNKWIEIH